MSLPCSQLRMRAPGALQMQAVLCICGVPFVHLCSFPTPDSQAQGKFLGCLATSWGHMGWKGCEHTDLVFFSGGNVFSLVLGLRVLLRCHFAMGKARY